MSEDTDYMWNMKYCYIDFEFNQTSNANVNLICVALAYANKPTETIWLEGNDAAKEGFAAWCKIHAKDTYFVAYSVEAEARSFLALGLDPAKFNWIDLYVEYRMLLNHNHRYAYGNQLIDGKVKKTTPPPNKYQVTEEERKQGQHDRPRFSLAAASYKLLRKKIDTEHKDLIRKRIIAGITSSPEDRKAILKYCKSDVANLAKLWKAIDMAFCKTFSKYRQDPNRGDAWYNSSHPLPLIELYEVLDRGEYAARTAKMVSVGYPVNRLQCVRLQAAVPLLLDSIRDEINSILIDTIDFQIFERDKKGKFKFNQKKLQMYLAEENLPGWLRTEKGAYSVSIDAFAAQTASRHDFEPTVLDQMYRFLRFKQSLNGFTPATKRGQKTLFDYLGDDDRVRPYFGIYGAQSARSQPSAISFIPLKSAWMRCLIQPVKGRMLCGIDYGSQEFLIAALLSKDEEMIGAYRSGDVYLHTAKLAGAVPQNGTRAEYEKERNLFKGVTLGISYDMSAKGLASHLTKILGSFVSVEKAGEYIDSFFDAYEDYAGWKREVVEAYKNYGYLKLPCGWTMFADNDNMRSVGNVPVQGAGSSIMRKAVAIAQDKGLQVAYTLHDALYIECDVNDFEAVDTLYDAMGEAFERYLGNAAEVKRDIFCWGEGLADKGEVTTPNGRTAETHSMYLDGRGKKDYELFKPYLEDSRLLL